MKKNGLETNSAAVVPIVEEKNPKQTFKLIEEN